MNIDILPEYKIAETTGDINKEILCWYQNKIINGSIKLNDSELSAVSYFSTKQI